jgi:transcriptional antiterminator NusG
MMAEEELGQAEQVEHVGQAGPAEEAGQTGLTEQAAEQIPPVRNERFRWYILHAYSGFERKVRESIQVEWRPSGWATEWAG